MQSTLTTTCEWSDCLLDPPDDEIAVLAFDPKEAETDKACKEGGHWFLVESGREIQPTLWCHIPHPTKNALDMETILTDYRYSHDEIEAACGGDVALSVRRKVMNRRADIMAGR